MEIVHRAWQIELIAMVNHLEGSEGWGECLVGTRVYWGTAQSMVEAIVMLTRFVFAM